jgi:enediyne biosynthesis protein E4
MIGRLYSLLGFVFLASACTLPTPKNFNQLNPNQTGINFINEVHETDSINVLDYFYLYNGAGVAAGDINNDGLDDLFFVSNHKGRNKLYLNKGNLKFEDITKTAGVTGKSDWSTGVAMVDINADGWLDIYVSTVNITGIFKSKNELYLNNHDGTFTERAVEYGLALSAHTTQTIFFDYNGDGLLDCYVLNHATNFHQSFRPAGNRKLIDSLSGHQLFKASRNQHNQISYEQVNPNSQPYFSSPLSFGLGVGVGDLNQDGIQDVYATNDFREQDYCYLSKPNGTWGEYGSSLFSHHSRFSMGCDIADYNNDGLLDIITLDMLPADEKILKASLGEEFSDTFDYKRSSGFHYQYARNCLHTAVSVGDSVFYQDIGLQAGIAATDWSWAPLFADFNNDGLKDLFISNGYLYRANDLDFNKFKSFEILKQQLKDSSKYLNLLSEIPHGKVHDYLFEGSANGIFNDQSEMWGLKDQDLSHGSTYTDLDNDGDLDLVVNRMNDVAAIYENQSATQNSISIVLRGLDSNAHGIGSVLYAFTGLDFQMIHQMPVRGFMSTVTTKLHFGLGNRSSLDSLWIVWPSGKRQVLQNITSNQQLTIYERDAVVANFNRPRKVNQNFNYQAVTELQDSSNPDINDFTANPFMVHKVSVEQRTLSLSDVNQDDIPDLLTSHGLYDGATKELLIKFSDETVDGVFLDADGDQDLDVITVSGGNQYYGADERIRDHLYINQGVNIFVERKSFPALYENKSCIRVADFDKDGDNDLFIGGRVNARMYGMTPASNLLLNDGKGEFSIATELIAPDLATVGMVTDACWTDVNKDGWLDLLLVGEYMPVTFYINENGKRLSRQPAVTTPSGGLWTCIYPIDIDEDGDQDFLLGNWGTNSKLLATEQFPLKLYIHDFDNNGDQDPVLALAKNKRYYTFLNKEDLEKRLPSLKKKYLSYTSMAGKTVEEIFGSALTKARVLEAHTLHSSLLLNTETGFKLLPLPKQLQTAPIFAFQSWQQNSQQYLLAGGNFSGVQPFEGRYLSLPLSVFQLQVNDGTVTLPLYQALSQPEEIKRLTKTSDANGTKFWMLTPSEIKSFRLQPIAKNF